MLTPMQWKTWLKNQLCVVNSDVQACRVPENEDYYICPSDKVPLVDLIEDELLLTLPQNPMHNDKNECDTEFIGYLSRYRHQTKENPFRMLKKL